MPRRVVLPIDERADVELIETACELACEHHARLELVNGVPKPWFTTCYATCPQRLEEELEAYGRSLVRAALDRVPCDAPVSVRCVRGSARRTVCGDGAYGETDLIVVRALKGREERLARRGTAQVLVAGRGLLVPELAAADAGDGAAGEARRRGLWRRRRPLAGEAHSPFLGPAG
jgi:hypothetical protein